MAFKMKNPSVMKMAKMAGDNRTAMKMKAEEAAAMKMKKAAMKLKEEAAMKKAHEAAMKLKKESAMKAAKPDFPDIDGDGNTSESMKKAAADKKSAMKLKKGKGTKTVDMPDFASTKQVKAKTGGNAKKLDNSEIKSPAKLRKPKPKRKNDGPKAIDKARKKVGDTSRPKGSAMKLEGDPKKEMTQAEKDAAIANAMPAAKTETLSKETMAGMKSYFGGVNADVGAVKAKIKELRAKTLRTGTSAKNQAKFDADLKEARRIAKARYPEQFR